jgi:hypothetical protein
VIKNRDKAIAHFKFQVGPSDKIFLCPAHYYVVTGKTQTCTATGLKTACSPPPIKLKHVIKNRDNAIREFGLTLPPGKKLFLCSFHYQWLLGMGREKKSELSGMARGGE